ncbi:MAG: thioredoxin family protein [Bacilli bacterium]|jgi:small redox-active disulfide protein 2
MKIQALGGCCKRSQANYEAVVAAVKELNLKIEVEHITNFEEILNLGVMMTPGLVIDGKVVASGRALDVKQAKELIQKAITK